MGQQLATVMQMTQRNFNELFVPPDRIGEHMREVFDLIARRAYEIYDHRGRDHGHDWEDWYQAESALLQSVNHEISDAGDAFLAVVDIAAYRPQDLKLSAEPHRLSICGCSAAQGSESSQPGNGAAHPRAFLLYCQFPAPINPAKASAEIRGDLLEVRLPKKAAATEASR